MGGLNDWKKKAAMQDPIPAAQRERSIRRQLAVAAGAESFQNRDPLYHISEDFQKTFDMMGAQKARQGGLEQTRGMPELAPGLSLARRRGKSEQEQGLFPGEEEEQAYARERFGRETDMDRMVAPSANPGNRLFLNRFSEIAFQRGALAGAVLRGTGKMMLFSCLKRTAGQFQPKNFRQRMLFEGGSVRRNVAGNAPDQVLFNRGAVDGAVGLVVDVLRDARRVVDSIGELAGGKNALPGGSGAETLHKMYPFLSDEKESALLKEYHMRLSGEQDANTKAQLQHAIVKTQALIAKKRQMKERFIVALRSVSDSASAALTVFSQPGFSAEMYSLLEKGAEPEPPPEGDEDDDKPEGVDAPS